MEAFVHQEKKNFSKAKTKFCLSFHYNSDNSYLFVNEKEIYKFKANNKNLNFLPQFSLGSIPNKFDYDDSEEVCFKGSVYDFSVDYDAIDKSNILRTHKLKVMYELFGIIKKMIIVFLSSIANASNHTKCAP